VGWASISMKAVDMIGKRPVLSREKPETRKKDKYQISRPIMEWHNYKNGYINFHFVIVVILFYGTMTGDYLRTLYLLLLLRLTSAT
jgi:hypothetical protein